MRGGGISEDSSVTFVPMSAIDEVTGTIARPQVRKFKDVSKGYTHFADGDVVLAKITPCMENGKAAIARRLVNGIGCGTTELHVMRPLGGISPEFLFHLVRQKSFRKAAEARMTGTAGQLRVPSSFIENSKVALPPLAEQFRIVSRIDELLQKSRAAKGALEQVPNTLARFRRSVLAKAFRGDLTEGDPNDEPAPALFNRIQVERKKRLGKTFHEPDVLTSSLPSLPKTWIWTRIRDICFVVTKGATPTSYGFTYVTTGIRFVKVENLDDGRISRQKITQFIAPNVHQFLKRSQLEANDVLFSIAGTIGKVSIVQEEDLPANTNQAIAIIRCPWRFVDPRYLASVLSSAVPQISIADRPRGVAMSNVSLEDVLNIVCPLPPIEEQRRIFARKAQLFSAANQIGAASRFGLQNVEKLEQSILAKAFRGEMIPQDPNDEPASVLLERIKAHRAMTGKKGSQMILEIAHRSRTAAKA